MAVKINEIVTTTSINTDDKVVVTQNGTETRRANAKDLVDKFTEGIKANVADLTKTVQDNKTEILNTIGTETMGTTATTLKGAIAEHTSQLNDNVQEINNVKNDIFTNYAKKTDVNDLANNKANLVDLQYTNTKVNQNSIDITTQKARIDSFTSLAQGSTTGDAELIDARISADGEKYNNVGIAIREQIKNIDKKNNYKELIVKSENLLRDRNLRTGFYSQDSSTNKLKYNSSNNNLLCQIVECKPNTTYNTSRLAYYAYGLKKDMETVSETIGTASESTSRTFTTTEHTYYLALTYDKTEYYNTDFPSCLNEGSDYPVARKLKKDCFIDDVILSKEQLEQIQGKEYHVGTGYEYLNLTACLKDLKGDNNIKTIYIHGGIYDMFEEIGGSAYALSIISGTKWADCNVIVPPNTKIVGIGNVLLNFKPTASQIGNIACNLLSPINLQGSSILENLTIIADNCRYCIHDETNGDEQFYGAYKKFKNVKCYKTKTGGVGYNQAYASGFDRNQKFEFDGCIFKSDIEAFSFHNRAIDSIYSSSSIDIKNCVIIGDSYKALRFGNSSSDTQKINVNIFNTYMNKDVYVNSETGASVNNAYDITMIGCKDKNVVFDSLVTNSYIPIVY